jgi:hypothetical protein
MMIARNERMLKVVLSIYVVPGDSPGHPVCTIAFAMVFFVFRLLSISNHS